MIRRLFMAGHKTPKNNPSLLFGLLVISHLVMIHSVYATPCQDLLGNEASSSAVQIRGRDQISSLMLERLRDFAFHIGARDESRADSPGQLVAVNSQGTQSARARTQRPRNERTFVPRSETPVIMEDIQKAAIRRIEVESGDQKAVIEKASIPEDVSILNPARRIIDGVEIHTWSGDVYNLRYSITTRLMSFFPSGYPKNAINFFLGQNREFAALFPPSFDIRFYHGIRGIRLGDLAEISRRFGTGTDIIFDRKNPDTVPVLDVKSIKSITFKTNMGVQLKYDLERVD